MSENRSVERSRRILRVIAEHLPGRNVFDAGGLRDGLHPLVALRLGDTGCDPVGDRMPETVKITSESGSVRFQTGTGPRMTMRGTLSAFSFRIVSARWSGSGVSFPHRLQQDDVGR
jgi:hypothetical protein